MSIYNRIAFLGIIALVVLMSVAGAVGNIFGGAPAGKGPQAQVQGQASAAAEPIIDKTSREAYDLLAKEATGLIAGAADSRKTVFVVFDPKCPHCADLWENSKALHSDVRFIWVPVAFLSRASLPEGAALLAGGVPLMESHEKQLLAKERIVLDKPSKEMLESVARNTVVANKLGLEGVPFMWHLDDAGVVHTANGGLSAEQLKAELKL